MIQLATTHFLNVDLDIYSKRDLQPLVKCLGRKVVPLYVGREGGSYSARLEVAKQRKTADSTIREFCVLIEHLPKPERALWDSATIRSFNVGIQAGTQPHSSEIFIRPATVRAIAAVYSQVVFTIYAPESAPAE